jgi:hypothetical protein
VTRLKSRKRERKKDKGSKQRLSNKVSHIDIIILEPQIITTIRICGRGDVYIGIYGIPSSSETWSVLVGDIKQGEIIGQTLGYTSMIQ